MYIEQNVQYIYKMYTSEMGNVKRDWDLDWADSREKVKQLVMNTATVDKARQQATYPRVIAAVISTPDSRHVHFTTELLHAMYTLGRHICCLHQNTYTVNDRKLSDTDNL